MGWKRKVGGGILATIGFLLSPLSWWNDLFVNVPLAAAFAWGVAALHKPAFGPALVIGYWLTNVLGLVLMQKGAQAAITGGSPKPYTTRDLLKDLAVSLLYTLVILALVKLGVLQPLTDYWKPQ
jgi:hypothetical protein